MRPLSVGLTAQPGSSTEYETGGWRTERPRFRNVLCTGCDLCIAFCPEGIVFQVAPKEYSFLDRYCKGCGICAYECPVHDIVMEVDQR